MANLKEQLEQIHINTMNTVVDILKNVDNTIPEDEWNEVLLYAAQITNTSVETVLACIREELDYEDWLANEAEEQYQTMMGAEHPVYGCDPYPEY